MKLIKQLPVIAFTLGMPIAHAQAPHGGIVSPFGPTPSTAAAAAPAGDSPKAAPANAGAPALSLAQAKAALTPAAAKKIRPHLLDAILKGEQRDVLVMFQDQSGATGIKQPAQRLSVEKSAFSTTRRNVQATVGAANVAFLREYDHLPFAFVRVQNNAALLSLLNHPQVISVVENVTLKPDTAESLPLIRQPQAIATGRRGAGTTVAVLDMGADISSSVFGNCTAANSPASCRVVATFDATGAGVTPGEGFTTGLDAHHGTLVAGIVAQVAPGTKLALVDVHRSGGATTADMIYGIDWVIRNQARYNIVAFNLSAGIPDIDQSNLRCVKGQNSPHDLMHAMFSRARAFNILPVVSAGNSYKMNPGQRNFPACAATDETSGLVEPAAVVAAVYDANMSYSGNGCAETGRPNQMTCFSARDPEVNIAAPGAIPDTGNGIRNYAGGTSFSAPHVAGAIAILRASDAAPQDSLAQTLGRLTNTGYDIGVPGQAYTARMPRLDVMASLDSVFHNTVTQQFYVALLGRPADPSGLNSFAQSLRATGAPSTIFDLNRLYDYSPQIRGLVDGVGSSAEAAALYPGDNNSFVAAMYQNILNRVPDAGSQAHWRDQLDRGLMTRGRVALAIAATAAEYNDAKTLYKRAAVATDFTKALDLPAEQASYQRGTGEARALIKSVDALTYVDEMGGFIDSTIAAMLRR